MQEENDNTHVVSLLSWMQEEMFRSLRTATKYRVEVCRIMF
jgi:hypothetical protein